MDVQRRTGLFKPVDPSYLTSCLDNFKTAYDSNSRHEGEAIQLFPHSIPEPAKEALWHQVTHDKKNCQQEGKSPKYCKVASYLLETNATYDAIAEAEADTKSFEQLFGMTAVLLLLRTFGENT